jgi:peptidoglycan/xylan/chitin deacetylase (PgdA/CDA1 family)
MYHRIANEPIDHWDNRVSPVHFEEHLRVIRRIRCAFPLAEFVKRHMAGTLQHDAVALTFDDGYVDNLLSGKPRLAAADVPATVFLSTGYLDRPGEFWWDELARLILLEGGPRSFELIMRGEPVHFDFAVEFEQFNCRSKDGVPSTTRQAILAVMWEAMRRLEDEERESAMAQLRSIFSASGSRVDRGRAMTREEVGRLVMDGLITIGAHTVTHPVLPELEADARNREIIESKRACETLIKAPVAGFAYPYGALDAKSCAAVMAAGFGFACSVRHGPTVATSDVFALPRIRVRDWDGDVFERAIRLASAV